MESVFVIHISLGLGGVHFCDPCPIKVGWSPFCLRFCDSYPIGVEESVFVILISLGLGGVCFCYPYPVEVGWSLFL